jgi:hypothetical protein
MVMGTATIMATATAAGMAVGAAASTERV